MFNEPLRGFDFMQKDLKKNVGDIIKNTGYFDAEQMVQCEKGNGEKTVKCLSQHQKLVVNETEN